MILEIPSQSELETNQDPLLFVDMEEFYVKAQEMECGIHDIKVWCASRDFFLLYFMIK